MQFKQPSLKTESLVGAVGGAILSGTAFYYFIQWGWKDFVGILGFFNPIIVLGITFVIEWKLYSWKKSKLLTTAEKNAKKLTKDIKVLNSKKKSVAENDQIKFSSKIKYLEERRDIIELLLLHDDHQNLEILLELRKEHDYFKCLYRESFITK